MTTKFLNNWGRFLFLGCFLAFNSTQAVFAQGQGEIIDDIIARVDDQIVLRSDLEGAYLQFREDYPDMPEQDARCEVLKQLVVNKLLFVKAEIDSVIVDAARVNSEMDRRFAYFVQQAGSPEALEKGMGKSLESLRDELREQVREQLTTQNMQQSITADIKITPAKVKKYFNAIPKDSIPFLPAELMVGQIVKKPDVSKPEKERVKARMLEFKTKILAGELTFAAVAEKYSEDLGSARLGGELGWQGRGELVPQFEAVAMKLKPGEISDPVESDFGFHMIQLIERNGNKFNSRHVLIKPVSSKGDLGSAIIFLDSLRDMIVKDSIKFERAAKDFSSDKPTSANGGFFSDPDFGGSYMASDQLDPVVFFTIDTMKVGSVSHPIAYRMDDGSDAVRILYYKEKKAPHYADYQKDYQKIYQAALNERKADEMDKWFLKAIKDVFIEISPKYDNCGLFQGL